MKRIISLMLTLILVCGMAFCFSSCSQEEDWEAIEEKGYFVCGITVYEPMNYFDAEGNLVGFDTEFAKAVADYLGVEVKFQVIDWPSKYLELNSGARTAYPVPSTLISPMHTLKTVSASSPFLLVLAS